MADGLLLAHTGMARTERTDPSGYGTGVRPVKPAPWECTAGVFGAGTHSQPHDKKRTVCTVGTLTIRTDPEIERALGTLTSEGMSRSEAARAAILEAERAHRRARLRAEAEELRNDPDDVAASRALAAEMDAARAW
jgi:hypothetical protein